MHGCDDRETGLFEHTKKKLSFECEKKYLLLHARILMCSGDSVVVGARWSRRQQQAALDRRRSVYQQRLSSCRVHAVQRRQADRAIV